MKYALMLAFSLGIGHSGQNPSPWPWSWYLETLALALALTLVLKAKIQVPGLGLDTSRPWPWHWSLRPKSKFLALALTPRDLGLVLGLGIAAAYRLFGFDHVMRPSFAVLRKRSRYTHSSCRYALPAYLASVVSTYDLQSVTCRATDIHFDTYLTTWQTSPLGKQPSLPASDPLPRKQSFWNRPAWYPGISSSGRVFHFW